MSVIEQSENKRPVLHFNFAFDGDIREEVLSSIFYLKNIIRNILLKTSVDWYIYICHDNYNVIVTLSLVDQNKSVDTFFSMHELDDYCLVQNRLKFKISDAVEEVVK